MKIEVQPLEGCKRRLDIQIPGAIVNDEIERAGAEMRRVARVPGFRPGHVPASLIKQRYRSELRQEALRNLLPSALETAVEQHKLRVVGEPSVEKLEFADDGALDVSVTVEVFPEFELGEYKGLPVAKRVYKVTDEDVERVIDQMREEQAQLVASDEEGREARDGDFVSVDLQGAYVDEGGGHEGHAHEPLKADDVSVEIGGENVHPQMTENLRGVKVGDTKTFRVEYPPESSAPEMAGHTIEYTARVAAIRVREVPDFDDEFASQVGEGEYETAEALRAAVREDLERQAGERTTREVEEAALDALVEAHDFPVPQTMAQGQAQARLQSLIRSLARRGIDPRGLHLDWAAVRDSSLQQAEREIRGLLVMDRIAEAEGINPSDEDVDAEVQRMADALGQPVEQLRARLTKEGGADSIRDQMRVRKVLDLVVDAARMTVEEVDGLHAGAAAKQGDRPQEDDAAAGEARLEEEP